MTDDFDPYYTWLGIPPDEQPATHYRLLGVRAFESNLDVISNAGDQRMAFLRTFQVGKRSALSQRLLNEMAAAKVCLLNPAQRKVYDEKLKADQPKPVASSPQVAPVYSPPTPILVPSRQASVVLPLPVATRLPSAPDPLALADPFADIAHEVPLPRVFPAKSAKEVSDDFSDQAMALVRAAVSRMQDAPLATAAYGVLALGTLMLLSFGLWIGLGGNRQPPQVAAIPEANAAASTPSTPKKPDIKPATVVPKVKEKKSPGSPTFSSLPSETLQTTPKAPPVPTPTVPSKDEHTKPEPAEKPAETNVAKSPPAVSSTASTVNPAVPPAETVPAPVPMPARVANTPLWNVVPGKFPQPHKARLSTLTNKLVEFAVPAKEVNVWPVPANFGEKIADPQIIKTPSNVLCVCFSRNDKLLAIGTETSLEVKDLETKQQWRIAIPGKAVDVVFCDDDNLVAVACQGRQPLAFFSLKTNSFIKTPQSNQGEIRTLSSSDQWLAALGTSGKISLYDLQQGIHHGDLVHQQKIPFTAVHMRGVHLFVFDRRCLTGWNAKELKQFSEASNLRTSPQLDDFDCHTGYFTQQEKGTLSVFKWSNNESPLARIAAHKGKFALVDIAHNRLLTNGPGDQLLLWNLDTLKDFQRRLDPAEEIAVLSGKPVSPGSASTASSTVPAPNPSLSDSGPLEKVEPELALAALRRIGVQNLPSDPTQVTSIGLQSTQFTNADAKYIAPFTGLESLFCDDRSIDGQALRYFRGLTKLKMLSLGGAAIRDDDLALISGLKELTGLRLQETKITEKGLAHLRGLSKLQQLQLPHDMGRGAISVIAEWKELQIINPFPAEMDDQDLASLSQLRHLRHLDLQRARLTPAGYQSLKNFPEVDSIQLSYDAPREALSYLSGMNLSHFNFPSTARDEDVSLLEQMPSLRSVSLNEIMTDAALERIAKYPAVEDLSLSSSKRIGDEGMRHLRASKTLKQLYLPVGIGDAGLRHLSNIPTLQNINLTPDCAVTDEGVAALVDMPNLGYFMASSKVSDRGCESLAKIASLRHLIFNKSRIGAAGLKKLKTLDKLESLTLYYVPLNQEAIKELKTLTQLHSLALQSSEVTPECRAIEC